MQILDLINTFYDSMELFEDRDILFNTLRNLCNHLGISYFAIVHHIDPGPVPDEIIRLTNYPAAWVRKFDAQQLAGRDPVHRASQVRGAGFPWTDLPRLLLLTRADQAHLRGAHRAGIGPGYTVPFHVPGEFSGSSSFAVRSGEQLQPGLFPLLQSLGAFAFEAARGLQHARERDRLWSPLLTARERDCVVQLAQGLNQKQIARTLGIHHGTVGQYLKNARSRYGVHKSSQLIVRGLMDGSISYNEILRA